jgi:hypothetical protein
MIFFSVEQWTTQHKFPSNKLVPAKHDLARHMQNERKKNIRERLSIGCRSSLSLGNNASISSGPQLPVLRGYRLFAASPHCVQAIKLSKVFFLLLKWKVQRLAHTPQNTTPLSDAIRQLNSQKPPATLSPQLFQGFSPMSLE